MQRFFLLLCVLCSILSACTAKGPERLTVMTHDSFAISEAVLADFEAANNVDVVFLASGDSGAALNKAILSQDAPLADVFYGVDNAFLSRALQAGIFEPYDAPILASISPEFDLDPTHNALPVDYADVCINYDKTWFSTRGLEVPATFQDLLQPDYANLLVVENPASSSPGLAFLLATIAEFGDPGYLDFWAALRENGVSVVDGWNTAYYTNFSASSGHGAQPLVVSYASSPAAEVIYADPPVDEAPTASMLGAGMCFRQVEFVGILKGTPQRRLAEKFVDFMLDLEFQQDMPLQMFVYPVNPQASLPVEFIQWAQVAEQPASLDPMLITTQRETWIAAWAETVLH
jgi:thiamine transport system substrate-binding protein